MPLERQAQGKPLVRAEVDFPDAPPDMRFREWYEALKTSLLHKFNNIAKDIEDLQIAVEKKVEDTDTVVTPVTPVQTTTVINQAEPAVRIIVLCAGYTPPGAGPDSVEMTVPFGPAGEVRTWTVQRVRLRAGSAGTRCVVSIEASSDPGVFAPRTLTDVALEENLNQAERTGVLGTVTSGESLRFNVLEFGTAQAWSLSVEITT